MLSRTSRALVPSLRRNIAAAAPASRAKLQHLVAIQQPAAAAQHQQKKTTTISQCQRSFHTTPVIHKGITPESADPQAPNPQPNNAAAAAGASQVIEATPLSDQNYHEVSEIYLDELLAEVERVQEEGSDMEAEYSVRYLVAQLKLAC
jgi:frataxin